MITTSIIHVYKLAYNTTALQGTLASAFLAALLSGTTKFSRGYGLGHPVGHCSRLRWPLNGAFIELHECRSVQLYVQ